MTNSICEWEHLEIAASGTVSSIGDYGHSYSGLTTYPTMHRIEKRLGSNSGLELVTSIIGSTERERAFVTIFNALSSYESLAKDWNTYNGDPPSPQSLRFARALLRRVSLHPEVTVPICVPISGGIFLQWRVNLNQLDFEADDHSILYHLKVGETTRSIGEISYSQRDYVQAWEQFNELFA